jgi:uncharacterized protein
MQRVPTISETLECDLSQFQLHHQELARMITLLAPTLNTVVCLRATSKCFYITGDELEELIKIKFLVTVTRPKARYRTLLKIFGPKFSPMEALTSKLEQPHKLVRYTTLPNGVRHGELVTIKTDGDRLLKKLWFKYGVAHGLVTTWYKTGQVHREAFVDNGLTDGVETVWYKTGALYTSRTWLHGVVQGVQETFYENCTPKERMTHVNGGIQGVAVSWWDNGVVSWERSYIHGELHGKSTHFTITGQKSSEYTYVLGMKQGRGCTWHNNGRLSEESWYDRNCLTGEMRSYYATGVLNLIINFENDHRSGISHEYDTDGRLIHSTEWLHDREHGLRIHWRADGSRSEEKYVKGVKHGESILVSPDGRVSKRLYSNGVLLGRSSKTTPVAEIDRCTSMLRSGARCRYRAKYGRDRCGLHAERDRAKKLQM